MEIWRPIKGFKYYMVSNLGRVKSLLRLVANNHRREVFVSGRIIKPGFDKKNGYLKIGLRKNNRSYTRPIHRLVATAFIPNPNGKPEVNHKDSDKLNNHVDNLEWVTRAENISHAVINGRYDNMVAGEDVSLAKLTRIQVRRIRRMYESGV